MWISCMVIYVNLQNTVVFLFQLVKQEPCFHLILSIVIFRVPSLFLIFPVLVGLYYLLMIVLG